MHMASVVLFFSHHFRLKGTSNVGRYITLGMPAALPQKMYFLISAFFFLISLFYIYFVPSHCRLHYLLAFLSVFVFAAVDVLWVAEKKEKGTSKLSLVIMQRRSRRGEARFFFIFIFLQRFLNLRVVAPTSTTYRTRPAHDVIFSRSPTHAAKRHTH